MTQSTKANDSGRNRLRRLSLHEKDDTYTCREALWIDYPARQQEIYNPVYNFIHPSDKEDAPRLFPPVVKLEAIAWLKRRREHARGYGVPFEVKYIPYGY